MDGKPQLLIDQPIINSILYYSVDIEAMQENKNNLNNYHKVADEQDNYSKAITFSPHPSQGDVATYQSFAKSLLRVLNLCFSSFYFGYAVAYLGTFDFTNMIKLYDISSNQNLIQGLLQGCVSIGAGIGALSGSIVLKVFSRRNTLLFTNAFAIASGIMVMFPNLYLFFVARLIQGLCVGLYSAVVPLFIKEYSPNEISGTMGALNQTFVAFGVFFAYSFQLILKQFSTEVEHWRYIYGFTLLTISAQTLLLVLVYWQETPKYYLQHDREPECVRFLESVYLPEYVGKVLAQKKKDLGIERTKSKAASNLPQMELESTSEKKLKRGRNFRIVTALHLAILQQFVGINSIVAYGVQIVAQAIPSLGNVIPVVLNFESVLASFIASILLAKLGRKIILQAGTLMATVTTSMVAIGFLVQSDNLSASNGLVISGLVIYMANFGLSLGPVVWLYIAEIVEPQIVPFSTLANWTAASVVIITFPILSKAFGTPVPLFFFFSVWSALSLLANYKLLIETKGKTEEQIKEIYCEK